MSNLLKKLENNQFLKNVIATIPIPVFIKDPKQDFALVYCNRQAELMMGVTKDKVIGKTDRDIFPLDQAEIFRLRDLEVVENKKELNVPQEIVKTPTGERVLHITKVPILSPDNSVLAIVVFCEDITERVLQDKNFIYVAKKIMMSNMARGISHEINNPLTIANFSIEKIKDSINPNGESVDLGKLYEGIEMLEAAVNRITKTVRSFSLLSLEIREESFSPCNLQELLEQSLILCNSKINNNRTKLEINCPTDVFFLGKKSFLIQAFANILENATEAVSLLDNGYIKIDATKDQGMITLEFKDNGPVIPAKIKEQVMNPFFTTKKGDQGAGLGLPIAKKIIESHGGSLEISSSLQTCFTVTLPYKQITTKEVL